VPWKEITRDQILFDPVIQTLCNNPKFKCPNYGHNWACPPHAPYLEKDIMTHNKFYLIYCRIDMNRQIQDKKTDWEGLNSYKYLRNCIEKEIEKFLELQNISINNVSILWDGHCNACEKEGLNCAIDEELPCRFPDRKRYSMEAVGINVTETVRNVDLEIEWPPKNHLFRFSLICTK
jgi:predicted metal-binding protein